MKNATQFKKGQIIEEFRDHDSHHYASFIIIDVDDDGVSAVCFYSSDECFNPFSNLSNELRETVYIQNNCILNSKTAYWKVDGKRVDSGD